MNCLVVIDVQNDFVTGSLGTPEAVEMLPRLLEKMRGFEGAVLMTLDTHFFCSAYRKNSEVCSAHYIREKVVEQLVLESMQRVLW